MNSPLHRPETPRRTITGIRVRQLFGLFDYSIDIPAAAQADQPSILILYGDNGSGKTTLLQMVYRLLDKQDNRGHRSFLAKVPFSSFSVTLSDSTEITARRPSQELVGTYRLRIAHAGTTTCEAEAIVDKELKVRSTQTMTPKQRNQWQQFVSELGQLDISFFFLADDRKTQDSSFVSPPDDLEEVTRAYHLALFRASSEQRVEEDKLMEAVRLLEDWIRDEVIKATNIGEANTGSIYVDVAKRIAEARRPGRPRKKAISDPRAFLETLEERSKPFARLGFVPSTRLADISITLSAANPGAQRTISDAITPYLNALKTRLDALDPLQALVSLLLTTLNAFYTNKRVSYHVSRGLQISTPSGSSLPLAKLSSGERQLLLLLSRVVRARREATIFIIDEPELSLNIKWQRKLVDTLLHLVEGTSVQFLLATHSLELIATHRKFVHKLDNELAEPDQ